MYKYLNQATLGFHNDDTGSTSTDGLAFGIDANEEAFLLNFESGKKILIGTEGSADFVIESNGDINVDSGGLYYDESTSFVGIGTTSACQ